MWTDGSMKLVFRLLFKFEHRGRFNTVKYLNPADKQCDQIWRNFTTLTRRYITLAILKRFIYYLTKILAYLGKFGQKFSVVNGQILNQYTSHLVTLLTRLYINYCKAFMPQYSRWHLSTLHLKQLGTILRLCKFVKTNIHSIPVYVH